MIWKDHNDYYLSRLALNTNTVVILIDYRLAPEFPYPHPVNDCYAVVRYVFDNPLEFDGNQDKIALIGESAGMNIFIWKVRAKNFSFWSYNFRRKRCGRYHAATAEGKKKITKTTNTGVSLDANGWFSSAFG